MTSIYRLRPIVDLPEFEGFGVDCSPSVLGRCDVFDDITPGYGAGEESKYWDVPRLSEAWEGLMLSGNVSPLNDYPCGNFVFPIFSDRARAALLELVSDSVEVLELEYSGRTYCFFNVLSVFDCLDLEKTRAQYWSVPPTTAISVDCYSFKTIPDSNCFRVYEDPMALFVSEEFKDVCSRAGLRGMEFIRVWPNDMELAWKELEPVKLV